jgi:hypothetical protein
MTMTVSQAVRSSSTPLSAAERRRVPSNRNGVVTIPTVSAPSSRAIRATTGGGAGAGAASLSCRDEDHVRAAQRSLELVDRLFRRRTSDAWIGTRAEPVRETFADRDLDRRVRDRESLAVGVDGDEVDLRDAGVHHPVDRVQPCAADADDADRGDVGGPLGRRHAMELRCWLQHGLEVAGRCPRRCGLGGHFVDLLHRRRGGDGRFRLRLRFGLGLAREIGDVLDRLVECGLGARIGGRRLGRLPAGLLRALCGLGLAEELRERALTHRRALARHRAPPSRGRGRPVLPARTGRT